jgi:hypothetical protein
MDIILKDFEFARAYIDDIVITSRTREEHLEYLRSVFSTLVKYNIAIKGKKYFIGYPSATVLGKKVDSFRISTIKEKLEAITKLAFLKTAKELETYLGIAG